MPQRRSIKNIIVESLVFLGLFASLGHMTVNFWERFMIESELVHLKTSLHSLKETITHIGAAYDSLHKELRNLIAVAEKQYPARLKDFEYSTRPTQPSLPVPRAVELKLDKTVKTDSFFAKHDKNTQKETPTDSKKLESLLNTEPLNSATITRNPLKSVGVGDTNMDPIENETGDIYSVNEQQNENKKLKALVNNKPLGAATITRNPLKSVGGGDTNLDPIENQRGDIYSINEPHNCLYSPSYKYCRRRYNNPYHNWRV